MASYIYIYSRFAKYCAHIIDPLLSPHFVPFCDARVDCSLELNNKNLLLRIFIKLDNEQDNKII